MSESNGEVNVKGSKIALWTIALIATLIIGGYAAEPPIPVKDFTGEPAYQVQRVVDGDTVILLIQGEERTVRLIGVDTPETVHPQKPVEAYGREASHFLTNLLKGESVYLEYESGPSQVDKYGRLLAYLYRAPDGLFVNLEIVRQGYGHAYTSYPFKYMEAFRFYEQKAREFQKGLWGIDEPVSTEPTIAPSESTQPALDSKSITVYITQTGRKYPQAGCRYLSKSKIPISMEEAKKKGYTPCKVCKPPQ